MKTMGWILDNGRNALLVFALLLTSGGWAYSQGMGAPSISPTPYVKDIAGIHTVGREKQIQQYTTWTKIRVIAAAFSDPKRLSNAKTGYQYPVTIDGNLEKKLLKSSGNVEFALVSDRTYLPVELDCTFLKSIVTEEFISTDCTEIAAWQLSKSKSSFGWGSDVDLIVFSSESLPKDNIDDASFKKYFVH